DSGGTLGMGQINGSNQIVRLDTHSLPFLSSSSNSATTDFTTWLTIYNLGSQGTLDWTNGGTLTNRAVNSLTIDTSADSGAVTINMGASTNVLTITSNAIQFMGPQNATLTGGQVGATGSEVIVDQLGGGILTISSLLSGGTGSYT